MSMICKSARFKFYPRLETKKPKDSSNKTYSNCKLCLMILKIRRSQKN